MEGTERVVMGGGNGEGCIGWRERVLGMVIQLLYIYYINKPSQQLFLVLPFTYLWTLVAAVMIMVNYTI